MWAEQMACKMQGLRKSAEEEEENKSFNENIDSLLLHIYKL